MVQNRKPGSKHKHLQFICQFIFHKDAKNTHWRKDGLFNKQHQDCWVSTCGKMKQESYISLVKKINSKWIKDLRPKTLKLLEAIPLGDGMGKGSVDKSQKVQK